MRKVNLPEGFFDHDWQQLAKMTRDVRLSKRYLAFALLAKGNNVVQTACMLDYTDRVIHRWLNRFKTEGIGGLCERNGRGRTSLLTKEVSDKLHAAFDDLHEIHYLVALEITQKVLGQRIASPTLNKYMKELGMKKVKNGIWTF